jgi:hypothetical protein
MVVVEDVRLGNCKFPIQDIQKLALNPTDVAFAKGTRHERPVDVFQRRIICVLREAVSIASSEEKKLCKYLGSKHEGAEEDAFVCPFLGVNG